MVVAVVVVVVMIVVIVGLIVIVATPVGCGQMGSTLMGPLQK